jgi:hypothetical protein
LGTALFAGRVDDEGSTSGVPVDAVTAEVRAHVVALHAALPRHLAHVSAAALGEGNEIFSLERSDGCALALVEGFAEGSAR